MNKRGFSIIELLLVMGIIAILGATLIFNLVNRKSTSELNLTAQKITTLMREAQSRSMSQTSSTAWGVHFDNRKNETFPYYSIFSGNSYAASGEEQKLALPNTLSFPDIASGYAADVMFAQISGLPSGSSSVKIALNNASTSSSTIQVDPGGAITY